MREVAERAGVSQPAVSAVLGGRRTSIRVSEATRRRILDAAKALDYHPNAAAKALVTRRTSTVGLFLSTETTGGWGNSYFGEILTAIERACRGRGYWVHTCRYDLTDIDRFVVPPEVRQRAMDGILTTGRVSAEVMVRLSESGLPCVCLGDNHEVAARFPVICHDGVGAGLDAARHAAELGHRRIALLGEPTTGRLDTATQLQRRLAGTQECAVSVFGPPGVRWDHSAGDALVTEWLATPVKARPSVLIGNAMTLMGILQALPARGLRCPEDLSLISDADTLLCQLASPPLTAIDQQLGELAQLACNLLIDHLEDGSKKALRPERIVKPGQLVCRQSVGLLEGQ